MFENIHGPEEISENEPEQENNSVEDSCGDFVEVAGELISGIIDVAAGIISDSD